MNELRRLVARDGANDDIAYLDAGFPDRPLKLWSARPRRHYADMPVLFVLHGAARNANDYRDYWLPLVDEAGILAIAIEYSKEHYPGLRWFNYGNLIDDAGLKLPRADSTYAIVERLFAALQAEGVTSTRHYGLFGHSAGGQFVHRAISADFRGNVAVAIAANSGSYAMPDLGTDFPYGLGKIAIDAASLRRILAYRLTVMIGAEDLDNTSDAFPKEPEAMLQGVTRFARAQRYIERAREIADQLDARCNWTLVEVPGVAHEGGKMSAVAGPIAAAALHAAAAC
jgi:hypothetical protein